MFDLGDEFMIESYRIPWLIWVQLLVMILLLIVLVFGFGIFALDLSDNPNCSSSSSSSSSLSSSGFSGKKPLFNATTSCSGSSKVGVKESDDEWKTKDLAGTSKVGIIDEEESIELNESSSGKDIDLYRLFARADHPCKYFNIAKEAFLKCLGLGYKSESSKQSKHGGKRKD